LRVFLLCSMEPVSRKTVTYLYIVVRIYTTRPVAPASCTAFTEKCGIERLADELTDLVKSNGKLKRPVDKRDVSGSVAPEYP
jgi:hypothetical protein